MNRSKLVSAEVRALRKVARGEVMLTEDGRVWQRADKPLEVEIRRLALTRPMPIDCTLDDQVLRLTNPGKEVLGGGRSPDAL